MIDPVIPSKQVYAIMVQLDGAWFVFQPYKNIKKKTYEKAKLYMHRHGMSITSRPSFKIDKVWIEFDPEEGT